MFYISDIKFSSLVLYVFRHIMLRALYLGIVYLIFWAFGSYGKK